MHNFIIEKILEKEKKEKELVQIELPIQEELPIKIKESEDIKRGITIIEY